MVTPHCKWYCLWLSVVIPFTAIELFLQFETNYKKVFNQLMTSPHTRNKTLPHAMNHEDWCPVNNGKSELEQLVHFWKVSVNKTADDVPLDVLARKMKLKHGYQVRHKGRLRLVSRN